MKKIAVGLTLAIAFSCFTISSVKADPLETWQAGAFMDNSLKAAALPVWKITQDGTVDSVPWVDATNPRFAVYDPGTPGDESDGVVLDKETGLIWQRSVDSSTYNWHQATAAAYDKYIGGRKGWRLPTVEELASLVNPNTTPSPVLPDGHPFVNVEPTSYWTSVTYTVYTNNAWVVDFNEGGAKVSDKDVAQKPLWCVRAGQGHDAY